MDRTTIDELSRQYPDSVFVHQGQHPNDSSHYQLQTYSQLVTDRGSQATHDQTFNQLQACSQVAQTKDKLYICTGDSLRSLELCFQQKFQNLILISFVDPWKKMHFPKCEDCSPKIKPAMVILGLNLSFIDIQMILASFFLYLCSNSSKLEKTDFLSLFQASI